MKIIKTNDLPLENAVHGNYKKQTILKDGEYSHIYTLGKVVLPSGISTADHGHDGRYEAFLVEKGKGAITFNGKDERVVEAGDFIITEANETHKVSNPFEEDLIMVFFEIKE